MGRQKYSRLNRSSSHQEQVRGLSKINEVNRQDVWQDIAEWLAPLPAEKTTNVRIADQGGSHDNH